MRHLAIALAVLSAAIPSVIAADWSKSYKVAGSPVLEVRCSDANVDLKAGSSGTISAHVVTKGWEIKPGEIEIVERQSGDRIDIEVKHPRGARWTWSSDGGMGRSVRVEISLPAQTRVRVATGDGNVTLRGLQSELRIETGDGNITGDGLDGRLEAHTGDGNIRVAGRFDSALIHTGDGNVELTALAGSTSNGQWRIHTGDGNVNLRLPSSLKADIDAVSGDGHVKTSLPLAISSGKPGTKQVRGRMNGGGPTMTVRSGDGNISLSAS